MKQEAESIYRWDDAKRNERLVIFKQEDGDGRDGDTR